MPKSGMKKLMASIFIFMFIFSIYIGLIHLNFNRFDLTNINSNKINNILKSSNNFHEIYYEKNPNYLPLRILTVIENDKSSYFDEFLYIYSVPLSLYTFNSKRFLAPQIFSTHKYYQKYFLDDWKQFCDKWGGVKEILYLGDLKDETISYYNTLLGVDSVDNTVFNSSNLFNITSSLAKYFWYKSNDVILAFANDSFSKGATTVINETGSISPNNYYHYVDGLSSTNLIDIYTSNNISLNTGAYYFAINDSNSFILNLKGKRNSTTYWTYDTNYNTNNSWVFFPKTYYPGNLSEWKLEIINRTNIGQKKYNLTVVNFSYYEKTLSLNDNYKSLQIVLNWTSLNDENLDLWLIAPNGQLVKGPLNFAYKDASSSKSEKISINYPEQGQWYILITGNQNQTVSFNLTISMEKENIYFSNCIESSSNAAVISSLTNYPLLYTDNSTIPNCTLEAIKFLNATNCIIVSPGQKIPDSIYNQLKLVGIQTFENLTTYNSIILKIKSLSNEPDFILTTSNNGIFSAAAYLAAYHGAPLLLTNNYSYNIHYKSLISYSQLERTVFQDPFAKNSLDQDVPIFKDMVNSSDTFYAWLNDMNADYSENKTVVIVEPFTNLYPTFDRSIIGKSIVGRFNGNDKDENSIMIMNSVFYPVLSFLNLTKIYAQAVMYLSAEENKTITNLNLNATNFSNNITATYSQDTVYHSYRNTTDGQIFMAYALNFSNYNIVLNNITSINITVIAKISYSNGSIIKAGWGIYNWSSNNILYINNTIFNSTSDQTDYYFIPKDSIFDFINQNMNNRTEIFFFVNTSNGNISIDVNYIKFKVEYMQLLNRPNSLSSSICYYHNFSHNSKLYNFSEFIPVNFTEANYNNINKTGYAQILNSLNNVSIWYYSGDAILNGSPFSNNSYILMMKNDVWRGYNTGGSPANPDPMHNNYVYPDASLYTWISTQYLN
ncbi:MAG: hypothetical protein ACTSRP_22940, partial [Candidatus Helarchaeota archaeon]